MHKNSVYTLYTCVTDAVIITASVTLHWCNVRNPFSSQSLSEALETQRKHQELHRSLQSELEDLNDRKRNVEIEKQKLQDICYEMKQSLLDTQLSVRKIKSLEDKVSL